MSEKADREYTRRIMDLIAQDVEGRLEKGFGFFVLVFPFGSPGTANYVGNANREDVKKVMREMLERWN